MVSLLASWIAPRFLDEAHLASLKQSFSAGVPYPHLSLSDFLLESKAEALANALKQEQFTHKESDLFSFSQTADLVQSKNEILASFSMMLGSKEFAQFMRALTGIGVKPGALDLAGSLYQSADYLLCHDDQVEDRKIAYIFYLSKGFSAEEGASFVLFNHEGKRPTTIAHRYPPAWNSLMAFEVSPLSFHMVEENCSAKDRYAIGGWLH